MSEESDRKVLDSEKAQLRKTGGVNVQRIPARWMKLRWLKTFFEGDLEISLVTVDGEPHLEIGRAKSQ